MITKEEMNYENIVRYGGMVLEYIEDQNEKICIAAVRNNAMALQFVKEQNEKICITAVRNNGMALQFVKRQTEDICCEALINNKNAEQFIKNKTPKIKYILNNIDKYSYKKVIREKDDEDLSIAGKIIRAKLLNKEMEDSINNYGCDTEQDRINIVRKNGLMLQKIVNQTEKICVAAIEQNPEAIQYVYPECMTDIVKMTAVTKDSTMLKYIDDQTEELCLIAVTRYPNTIQYVSPECMTNTVKMTAVKKDPAMLKYIDDQTDELCLEAVKQNPKMLQYVNNQTEEICLKAVSMDGLTLAWAVVQSDDICLEAVKQDPYAIEYVNEKTKEICLKAVQLNGYVVGYIDKNHDNYREICLEAVKQNPYAINYINSKCEDYEEICISALEKKGELIECIPQDCQTSKICEVAFNTEISKPMNNRHNIFKYIKDEFKTYDMCTHAIKDFKNNANISNIKYIPSSLFDKELADFAFFKLDMDTIRVLPQQIISYEMCLKIVESDFHSVRRYFKYIPEEFYNINDHELEKKCIKIINDNNYPDNNAMKDFLRKTQKSELICLYFLNKSVNFIIYIDIENQTEAIINKVLENNIIDYIIYLDPKKLPEEAIINAINKKSKDICKHFASIKDLSENIYNNIVDSFPNLIRYIYNPSKDLCIRAAKRTPTMIIKYLNENESATIYDEVYIEVLKKEFKKILDNVGVDSSKKKSILNTLYLDIIKEDKLSEVDMDIIKDLKDISDNIHKND